MSTYRILLGGVVAESDLNAASPLQVTVLQTSTAATRLSVCTDQSGLIGLLRYLHGLGFVLLEVKRLPQRQHLP